MIDKESSLSASTTLTFLFTDLEGSTRLWQQFPEAMKAALTRHDELLKAAVEGAGGRVVKTTGDGIHAVFAAARDGLCACLDAQQNLLAQSWGEMGPLLVRMGLHSGDAQERGGDFYGTTVNRAARLMAAANGGQVLLSSAAADLVANRLPNGATLRDLGEHRLKDLLRPEHIFQLVHPSLPTSFPPIASLNQIPNNLPSQPTLFVGRQNELDEIRNLLVSDAVRLLTLTGPGGTGKTRLALQVSAEVIDLFPDGTYLIELAPFRDRDAVLAAIARTIGLNETGSDTMLDDLKNQLRDKRMLLLLDNFEQVTAAAVWVVELLLNCPHLKVLVTSREGLHVRGEYLYPVPPLGLPDVSISRLTKEQLAQYEAVQLFVERAQAVRPGFELTDENAEAIAELSLRLDGLPLAIELAAARVRLFSPQALRQRLGNRLELLRGGARDLPERQKTLRDTIAWSYDLLAAHEKTLFEMLSIFSSGTLEAAEAVALEIARLVESDVDIVEGLVSLVDKSLVRLADDTGAESRLRMLETIREFAADRLAEDPELENEACRAHASYFASFIHQQGEHLTGYERDAALTGLAADVANLRTAWHFWVKEQNLEQLQKMVDGLWSLYDGRGWYQATVELTTDLLNVLSETPSTPEQAQQEITLQTSLARAIMALRGYTPEVEEAYTRALKLSEGHDEVPQLFPVLRGLSNYYLYRAEFDHGVRMGEKILKLAESKDDDEMKVHGYLVLGVNSGFQSGLERGLDILDKGICLFNPDKQRSRPFQLGNNAGIVSYTTSAFMTWWLGYPDRAFDHAVKALEAASRLNHPFTMAYALFHTGVLHFWRKDLDLALDRAQTLLELTTEHEYQLWNSLATILFGAVKSALGQPEEGLTRLEQGIASYLGHISPPIFWPLLTAMRAEAFGRAGKAAKGLDLLDELLNQDTDGRIMALSPELGLIKGTLLLARSQSDAAEAAGMFSQVLAIGQASGSKMLALQAATNLCRLEMHLGKADESGAILEEIYSSFTEGFETSVLREARAVLETLKR